MPMLVQILLVPSLLLAGAPLRQARAGEGSVAVIDLSEEPQSSLAEAFRRLRPLKSRALSSTKTAAIVRDAADLGIGCAAADVKCLQKLVVIARVDEILAFAASEGEIVVTRVQADRGRSERVRVSGGASARAGIAWAAVEGELKASTEAPPPKGTPTDPPPKRTDPAGEGDPRSVSDRVENGRDGNGAPTLAAEPASSSTSLPALSPALLVAMGGGAAALGFGAGAAGVSAEMAKRLDATRNGAPLDDSYYDLELAFWSMAGLAALGIAAAAVGIGFIVLDDEPATPVSEP